jgi:hypothetical protein
MHENNTRNLPVKLSLSQTSKNIMSVLLSFMFSLLQNWRTGGWNRFGVERAGIGGRREVVGKGVGG